MAWQDRPYNNSGGGAHGYLGNPASLLAFSLPFGTWGPVRVRLHFWLLISFLFILIGYGRTAGFALGIVHCALFLVALLLHEFGNRFGAQQVGGTHDEFMLWPAGGMIPPSCPPTPWATFVAHVGGIVANLILVLTCAAALWFMGSPYFIPPLNPLAVFGGSDISELMKRMDLSPKLLLECFMFVNAAIMWAALMPFYWFKGAYILQGILWKWTGYKQAINVTCIVGMVLAVPMFLLAMMSTNLMGMIIWALLFASSFSRRKQLQYEPESDYQDSLSWRENRRSPSKKVSALAKWKDKRSAQRQKDLQEQVDRILDKVSSEGMHSLSASEKRTLQQASEELKDR